MELRPRELLTSHADWAELSDNLQLCFLCLHLFDFWMLSTPTYFRKRARDRVDTNIPISVIWTYHYMTCTVGTNWPLQAAQNPLHGTKQFSSPVSVVTAAALVFWLLLSCGTQYVPACNTVLTLHVNVADYYQPAVSLLFIALYCSEMQLVTHLLPVAVVVGVTDSWVSKLFDRVASRILSCFVFTDMGSD